MTDLVEQLRDVRSGHPLDIACHMDDLCMEAAIALEAKEAEIAVKTQAVADMARTIAEFQERVKELEAEAPRLLTEQRRTLCAEHDKDIQKLRRAKEIILDMEARAETAERRVAELGAETATAKKWQQWAEDERAKFERERDEARAALKQISDGYGPNHGSKFCRDVANRAVIEKE